MKNFSLKLTASLILHTELLCLVGLILFTDGYRTPVRLINPSSPMSSPLAGRLEVWYNGTWGTVCYDGFTDAAARVVCFSLGFGRTGRFIQNTFGSGSGQIWLDEVNCAGTEIDIDSCSHSPWGINNCVHTEDVAISCGHIPVRLVNPNSSLSSPYAGRLEVRLYYTSTGEWGTVCDDYFNAAAARVICYILGFGRAGSTVPNRFGSGSGDIWLNGISCNGRETDINRCSHRGWGRYTCQDSNNVAIKCDVKDCIGDESRCELASTACVSINRSNTCSCKTGFASPNETTCMDLNECTYPPSGCTSRAGTCVNTFGSYTCSCNNGYTQTTSTVCSDIDECIHGPSECNSATGYCVNTNGSYYCSCRSGYGNIRSTMCTDIDECSTGQSQCDSASTICVNTLGSYRCPCRNGFENKYWDSRYWTCRDIDECTNGQSQCDASTTICINTAGSYNCSCKEGFKYSTFSSCTDIDECVSNKSECDLKSTNCINTVGNYTCLCKNGFTYLNETTCLEGLIEESSQERFGLGAIVGTCVGAFLVVAAVAILILLFCWRRRNEANQPPQRQCSEVDNGPGVENYYGNPIVYMELDQTALGMGRKTTKNDQIEASTSLPVPTEETKATAQSLVYGNVQSSIYATVVSSVDVNAQSAIYENVQE